MVEVSAALAGFIVAVYVIGLVVSWVRFTAARLPGDAAASSLSNHQLFGAGLSSTALTAAAFAVLSLLAYLTSSYRWEINGQDWHDIVRERGVRKARSAPKSVDAGRAERIVAAKARKDQLSLRQRLTSPAPSPELVAPAPLGDAAVRIIAGFNILVLAGLLSLIPARFLDSVLPAAWRAALGSSLFLGVWAIAFVVLHQVLTRVNPLRFPSLHWLPWAIIGVGALLTAAPIGVLALTGVGVSTAGRAIPRMRRPGSLSELARSPLPWILLAIVTLLSLAYHAMPPVSFPGAVLSTTAGEISGGYLNRTASGIYVVTCTALADATSSDERVRFIKAADVSAVALGGPTVALDSGERPSLITLGLRALGLDGALAPLLTADIRPQQGTCGGADPRRLTAARVDGALGAGVIVQSPGNAVNQAHDGEAPIEQQTKSPSIPAPAHQRIAALARQYQPTLLVTVADRFWPVSVNALFADRGPHGGRTCLMQQRSKPVCGMQLTAQSLAGGGTRPSDYLQFPVRLTHDPRGIGQFKAFQSGQYIDPGPVHGWLSDPGRLRPWYTAEMYFYWGRSVKFSDFPTPPTSAPDASASASERFVPLEYWFYYPYNYFPLLATSALMNQAPLAGDKLNVDLHQGDWEHIDVLLDPKTLAPKWLYMARHSGEGQFIQWGSPSLALDGGHPLVQAGFGGHPTYEPGCGAQIRHQPTSALVDWLVCGSGRFAFRAAGTPLVDIASTPWACWPGHFGAAGTLDEIHSANKREGILDAARGQIFVAGPQAPVRQAENSHICPDALGPEAAAAATYFGPKAPGQQAGQLGARRSLPPRSPARSRAASGL